MTDRISERTALQFCPGGDAPGVFSARTMGTVGTVPRFWHLEKVVLIAAVFVFLCGAIAGGYYGRSAPGAKEPDPGHYGATTVTPAADSAGPASAPGGATAPAPALWPVLEDHRAFSTLVEGCPGGPRGDVKGIYLTGASAGNEAFVRRVFDLVEDSEINALVIDVKDNSGRTTYRSQLQQVQDIDASSGRIADLGGLLRRCEEAGIYTICRLVVFADPILAVARPELAVHSARGGIWRDHTGSGWTNPYLPEVWEYNLAIAREVAALGCREIQFDYVRFPSDGDVAGIRYPVKTDQEPAEVIEGFLKQSKEQLSAYGVFVAADIFGLVTSFTHDMHIGQILENVARQVDFVCPMMYPSHYAKGNYGLPDPEAAPYLTVRTGLDDALRRLPGEQLKLRPWLQDFSWRHTYGVAEVQDQIRAARELGVNGYMLWNPRNVYTEDAVRTQLKAASLEEETE